MDFLSKLLQGIAFVPSIVTGIEGLFASRSGAEKKNAAMSFVSAALQLTDAVTSRHIVDPEKFKQGLSAVIDGTVLLLECFHLVKADSALSHPISSLQFSSVFFTWAMNWSATAPSMRR